MVVNATFSNLLIFALSPVFW